MWVSGEFSQLIARIDPAENRVVERIPVANRPKGLALLDNQVWFAVQPSGAGHRGGRLVVSGSGFIVGQIDPSFISWSGTATALSSVYDSLVGPARRGGSDGTRVVPNLASSLPVTTAGGTTYAFQLRRGIRYSDGTLVKASDFRRAFERPLRAGIPQVAEAPLVGSGACEKQPRSCDLSRGIRTDDATGTIVFHLRRPERGFLSVLIRVFPIPRGTPDRNMRTRPVASTGPYMIESYVPGRALTLVRNPYFGVWARAARPDGFPDEIQFRLTGPQGVTAIERGRADVAFLSSSQTEDVKALAEFERATRRMSTYIRRGRSSSSSSIRHILRSTMCGCGKPSTTPSTVAPFQGRTGVPGSPSRPASPACQAPWPSSATAPTLPARARRANGRRLTWRLRAALSPPPGRAA